MAGTSYLKQLAARTSGDLPTLRPPRSPFPQLGAMQIVESFSGQSSPSTPLDSELPTVEKARQLPSFESPINPIAPTFHAVEPLKIQPISPFSIEPNSVPAFEEIKSDSNSLAPTEFIADRSKLSLDPSGQSPLKSRGREIDPISVINDREVKIDSRNERLRQQLQFPQQKLVPNLPFDSTRLQSDRQNQAIIRDRPPRLTPRVNSDHFSAPEENLDSSIEAHLPVQSPPNLAASNRIQIGSIEIQITPSIPPPPIIPIAKTAIRSTSTASLSRGFSSGFGLRQG